MPATNQNNKKRINSNTNEEIQQPLAQRTRSGRSSRCNLPGTSEQTEINQNTLATHQLASFQNSSATNSSEEPIHETTHTSNVERLRQLSEIFKNGKNNIFEKKKFYFGKFVREYRPCLSFFECKTKFSEPPQHPIKFQCLICLKIYNAKLS